MKIWLKIVSGTVVVLIVGVGVFVFAQKRRAVDATNLPQFIQADFIDLSKIYSISKFRSGEGHDFSGNGETCRSMKHYYTPQYDATTENYRQQNNGLPPQPDGKTDIPIYSPVDGTVSQISGEQTPIGEQIYITPKNARQFTVRLFHVYPLEGIRRGSKVTAGQKIGVIGKNQGTDISVESGPKWDQSFISYFDVMPDSVFANYQQRGMTSRSDFIFSKEYRDAHPFSCGGEQNETFQHKSDYDSETNIVPLSGYLAPDYEPTSTNQPSIGNKSTQIHSTPSSSKQAVSWEFDGNRWRSTGTVPSCADPITLTSPVDVTKVTAILYPGQTRGGNYKPHGGFRLDNTTNGDIDVVIPLEATVKEASRYIEQGEVQYLFGFVNSCGIMFRLDHLRTLSSKFQKIAEGLPEAKPDDSRTTPITTPTTVTAGEKIATAVGFAKSSNFGVDFGVYDLRSPNEASKNVDFATIHADEKSLAYFGVCWFNMLPAGDATKVKSLPAGDGQQGKTSDYCHD